MLTLWDRSVLMSPNTNDVMYLYFFRALLHIWCRSSMLAIASLTELFYITLNLLIISNQPEEKRMYACVHPFSCRFLGKKIAKFVRGCEELKNELQPESEIWITGSFKWKRRIFFFLRLQTIKGISQWQLNISHTNRSCLLSNYGILSSDMVFICFAFVRLGACNHFQSLHPPKCVQSQE